MLKCNTGSSINQNPELAAAQAAAKAIEGLDSVKMAFVYGSADYDIKAMMAGVTKAMPNIPVIGNTSFTGVITPEGYISSENGFIGIMAMSDADLAVGIAASERTADSPEVIGAKIAKEAMQAAGKTCAPDYFYMVASPAEEEHYLKGITEVIGRVPFFGGSAADNEIAG
ncbi:MAG: hypothetical protein J5968_06470, partial [Oscillospiraceae bacterium]|nr:hypothetical protein [Oscillospiraceae bacterium]